MRPLALLAVVGAVLVGSAGVGTTAVAVAATDWRPVATTGAPGRLVLDTGPTPLALPDPAHGDDVTWQIRTRVEEPGPVTLDLQVQGRGEHRAGTDGVMVSVATCDEAWRDPDSAPTCDGRDAELVSATPAADWATASPAVRIPDPDGDGTAYLLVRLSLGDPATPLAPSAEVGIGVTAQGDGPGPRPGPGPGPGPGPAPGVLAMTGGGFLGPVLVAVAALLTGVALRLRRPVPAAGGAP